jgi:ATP-dependent RNA helicase HelY
MNNLRAEFLSGISYTPDAFQIKAMDSIDADASVLVAAPTGSGKTLIAEYGIARARSEKLRAFYTTPIKALSNQKYRDLCELYGAHNVGLVTGDNAVNPEAAVVVMTTEVLRNMIYASSTRLDNLGVVVLDEVHYLQDAYRGPVWEEVIIQLDPEVQLVCLSATVSNADEVGEWLTTVRGRTDVVVETTRPIELVHHFAMHDSNNGRTDMYDTVVNGEPNRHIQRLLTPTRPKALKTFFSTDSS